MVFLSKSVYDICKAENLALYLRLLLSLFLQISSGMGVATSFASLSMGCSFYAPYCKL